MIQMKFVIPKLHSSNAFMPAWSCDSISTSKWLDIGIFEAEERTRSKPKTGLSIEARVTILTPTFNQCLLNVQHSGVCFVYKNLKEALVADCLISWAFNELPLNSSNPGHCTMWNALGIFIKGHKTPNISLSV